MYVIIVYDVDTDRNRPVLTFLRTHLNWVQNSVFEGEVTEAELRSIKKQLHDLIDPGDDDSIIIYSFGSKSYVDRETIGEQKGTTDRVI